LKTRTLGLFFSHVTHQFHSKHFCHFSVSHRVTNHILVGYLSAVPLIFRKCICRIRLKKKPNQKTTTEEQQQNPKQTTTVRKHQNIYSKGNPTLERLADLTSPPLTEEPDTSVWLDYRIMSSHHRTGWRLNGLRWNKPLFKQTHIQQVAGANKKP